VYSVQYYVPRIAHLTRKFLSQKNKTRRSRSVLVFVKIRNEKTLPSFLAKDAEKLADTLLILARRHIFSKAILRIYNINGCQGWHPGRAHAMCMISETE